MSVRSVFVAACLAVLSAGCAAPPPAGVTAPAEYELKASNGTTLAVTLVVNGSVVGTVDPGGQASIPTRDLPPLPWDVQARTPSGRLLSSMTVKLGDVTQTATSNGGREYKGDAVRIDLSCGRLDVWTGLPLLGPMPGPGRPGDCER